MQVLAAAQVVRDRVERYVELIAEAAGLQIQIEEIPTAAQQIGYLAAVTMQIDNKEKQELLGSASVAQMLRREMALLNRENALLHLDVGQQGVARGGAVRLQRHIAAKLVSPNASLLRVAKSSLRIQI